MLEYIESPSQDALDMFRLSINDLVEVNRLLDTQQLDDSRLSLALKMAVDEYNSKPPIIGPRITRMEDFPSATMLFHGASVNAFKMSGLMQLRNMLPYNDGGVNVSINDFEDRYMRWMQDYRNEWKTWIIDFKSSKNYENAFGSSSSEYALTGIRR